MKTSVVIIGAGIAGLSLAYYLSKHKEIEIVILSKSKITQSSSELAQGGIAAVGLTEDSYENHINDTLKAGSYHNDVDIVRKIINEAPTIIEDLIKMGVVFNEGLAKEGGHKYKRVHFVKDYTGKAIMQTLRLNLKKRSNIKIIEDAFVTDIANQVSYIKNNQIYNLKSAYIVLATGGVGQLFKFTTNPLISTGDGLALASVVNAQFADLEFIQFHPTVFNMTNLLISEAVRGEGALLLNSKQERFVDELAARDIVALSIYNCSDSRAYLDCRKIANFKLRFPTIYKAVLANGYDATKDLIPVNPAAHYLCGGIKTDIYGQTNIDGLFAIGETACTGLHGANRLASNSLLEALVVAKNLSEIILDKKHFKYTNISQKNNFKFEKPVQSDYKKLQEIMWDNVGIVRTQKKLQAALKFINSELQKTSQDEIQYKFMLTAAQMIAVSALKRKKTIGCHQIV